MFEFKYLLKLKFNDVSLLGLITLYTKIKTGRVCHEQDNNYL